MGLHLQLHQDPQGGPPGCHARQVLDPAHATAIDQAAAQTKAVPCEGALPLGMPLQAG